MIRQAFIIGWFSALEALGHPVTMLLTLASAAGTLTLPLMQFQRFSEDGRLARDCGLATVVLFGVILAMGAACRLGRSLNDGTSAIALVKPLSRGTWLLGNLLGSLGMVAVYLLTQGAAVVLAEAYSPQYHSGGTAPATARILLALGTLLLSLLLAAANNRFRHARFVLTASWLFPVVLWCQVPFATIHWGDFSALLAVAFLLIQLTTLATTLAVRCSAGVTVGLTLICTALLLRYGWGSAFLPLDALARGGHVPMRTLLLLLPQTLCVSAFLFWCGSQLLNRRASV